MQNSPTNIPETFAPIRWPEVEWVALSELKANPRTPARTRTSKSRKSGAASEPLDRSTRSLSTRTTSFSPAMGAQKRRGRVLTFASAALSPFNRYAKRAYLIADNRSPKKPAGIASCWRLSSASSSSSCPRTGSMSR